MKITVCDVCFHMPNCIRLEVLFDFASHFGMTYDQFPHVM